MDNQKLITLSEKYGSPLYVYDAEKISNQYQKIISAFQNVNSLKINYPKTIEFLSSYSYYDTDFLIYLAKLEHNYAIHTSK